MRGVPKGARKRRTPLPSAAKKKKIFVSKYKRKAQNVLKLKNVKKYLVRFLQGYRLKTWTFFKIFFL